MVKSARQCLDAQCWQLSQRIQLWFLAPHSGSQPSIILVPVNLTPSSGFSNHCTQCADMHVGKILIHIKIKMILKRSTGKQIHIIVRWKQGGNNNQVSWYHPANWLPWPRMKGSLFFLFLGSLWESFDYSQYLLFLLTLKPSSSKVQPQS